MSTTVSYKVMGRKRISLYVGNVFDEIQSDIYPKDGYRLCKKYIYEP